MELAKQKFLEEYSEYGYNNRLNAILSKEFPNLVTHPQIYLDNTAIPPIPTQLVISLATAQASVPWLQNPHSSPQIHDQINLTRLNLLNYFKCSELEYEVIFCSNVTHGLKLIGEHFPWSETSKLILSTQNHTSMVGIREYAQKAGSSTELINLEDLYNNEFKFNSNCDKSYNLLCLPAQTNWNGLKLPSNLSLQSIIPGNTLTLIDFASYAQSNALNIPVFGADFNLISFYKIFGIMTGLSCLIVKKSSLNKLNSMYFGGGGLLACDIYSPYKELNSNTCWEFGTPNYMDILNLTNCFHYFDSVFGNMESVRLHTKSLTNWTKLELKKLKHFNNAPLIELYSNDEKFDYGPIIAFNILRSNGEKVGLKHLESILNLNNIIVRVGSLCNPGSNQLYLNVTGEQVRESFNKGIRCGDGELGVCRVSLGKVTTFEECYELVKVIKEKFIEAEELTKQIDNTKNYKLPEVLEINIYPIKSCKSYKIPLNKPWPILKSGLKFDRKLKLINLDTRRTMIQKNYSILAQFVPIINFESGEVCIDFNGDTSPIIKFEKIKGVEVKRVIIDDKEESILILNTPELDLWLRKFFDFKVALITSPEATTTYPNQAPLLAILSEDLEDFRLKSGVNYIPSNRFRANLTLRGVKLKAEDIIKIGNCQFKVEEPCERCSMITVDQGNSKRDLKIYSNLVKLGSNQGFGKFGWYLKLITEINNSEEILFNCQ